MRFHCGISFSWRTIKKYLIPFLLGLLISLGLNVNALDNYNTQYNLNVSDYDSIYNNIYCGNESIKDFLHNFISSYNDSNSLYNIIIVPRLSPTNTQYLNDSYIGFYTYKKTDTRFNRFSFYTTSDYVYFGYNYNDNVNLHGAYSYYLTLDTCDSSLSNSSSFQKYLDYLSGTYNPSWIPGSEIDKDNQGFLFTYGYPTNSSFLKRYSDNQTFNYTDNFTLNNTNWYYWSNRTLIYRAIYDSYYNSSSNYWKKLYISQNNTTYNYLDNLPSYWDLKYNNPLTEIIDYKSKLGTLYFNFLPSQLSNLSFNLSFNTTNLTANEYKNNIYLNWSCFGRINHNDNYYSYYEFPYCDFEDNSDYILNSNLLNLTYENFNFYDSNNNIITDFSNYDKIFIYLDFNYKNYDLDKTLSNLSITSTFNYYLSDTFLGSIYDNFYNLSIYFKLFITSKNNTYISVRNNISPLTDKYFLYKQFYNISNLNTIGNVTYVSNDFQQLYLDSSNNGLMIYQTKSDLNSLIDPNNLDFIFTKDVIVSISSISSDNFYYYDNTGNIVNSDIIVNYDMNPTNSYDLSYYFTNIDNFLWSMNYKIGYLHNITQDFYDNIPSLLQSVIFILFLLLLVFIIYKELRR